MPAKAVDYFDKTPGKLVSRIVAHRKPYSRCGYTQDPVFTGKIAVKVCVAVFGHIVPFGGNAVKFAVAPYLRQIAVERFFELIAIFGLCRTEAVGHCYDRCGNICNITIILVHRIEKSGICSTGIYLSGFDRGKHIRKIIVIDDLAVRVQLRRQF